MRLWFGVCPDCGMEVAGRNRDNFKANGSAHKAMFHAEVTA
jgi:hypothetical protein